MRADIVKAKKALDKVINKSRVHFYKPTQIAEILHHNRTKSKIELSDLESYRNISKRWRDEVSTLLIGRISTSSQKYQDNLFESNAIQPSLLTVLGKENNKGSGLIEVYIYRSMLKKLSTLHKVGKKIETATPKNFSLKDLMSSFTKDAGLKRSIDKVYEISVYALFSTIVRALNAQITIEIGNKDPDILKDFNLFIKTVLGLGSKKHKLTLPAKLYRVGVTNAADRGIDMWANFGAAVQIKHISLTRDEAEDIAGNIKADKIVIVCLDAEKGTIKSIMKQVGWGERIQGIITLSDLIGWYTLCMSRKYRKMLGLTLLKDLRREFDAEFPSSKAMEPFMKKRGYNKIKLTGDWSI